MQSVEGLSLRKTVVKIGTTPFLQDFLRLRKKVAMDHTFLDKCRLAIRPATQRKINEIVAQYAIRIGAIDPTVIRADTTVVDADIHYPTDSSLLWDVWRVAARMLDDARGLDPILAGLRFHTLKIKGLHLFITRYSKSTSAKRQRAVKEHFRLLIERTGRLIEQAAAFVERAQRSASIELQALASGLSGLSAHDADHSSERDSGAASGRDGARLGAGVQPLRAAYRTDPARAAGKADRVRA